MKTNSSVILNMNSSRLDLHLAKRPLNQESGCSLSNTANSLWLASLETLLIQHSTSMITELSVKFHPYAITWVMPQSSLTYHKFNQSLEFQEENGLTAVKRFTPSYSVTGLTILPQRFQLSLRADSKCSSIQEIRTSFATGEEVRPGLMPSNGLVNQSSMLLHTKTGWSTDKLPANSRSTRTLNSWESTTQDIWYLWTNQTMPLLCLTHSSLANSPTRNHKRKSSSSNESQIYTILSLWDCSSRTISYRGYDNTALTWHSNACKEWIEKR